MNAVDATFLEFRKRSRVALMPYLPLGFPTMELSLELIRTVAKAGADVIELGIPFSDPLADGPVIQHATQIALENGMSLAKCLKMVAAARAGYVDIPLLLMGYYNPILRFGVDRFARGASEARVDGLIVPDLPPEEASELKDACRRNSLDLVFLAAPTSTEDRLAKVAAATSGFIYLASLTGVTGMRDALPPELEEFVSRVRALTDKPLCIGFGISSGETARRVAEIADGVIVGSALVSRIQDPDTALKSAGEFVRDLKKSMSDESKDGQNEEG
jgi:tryptophan synthase alpha chain